MPDDLRSELEAQYDASATGTPAPAPEASPTPAPATPSEASPPPPAAAAPQPSPAPAPAQTQDAKDLAVAAQAVAEDRPIPERLKAKWGEKWKTIDKELREEFHQYESHIGALSSKYGKGAKAWEGIQKTVMPYQQMLKEEGVELNTAVGNLLEMARVFRYGQPEQKQALYSQIAKMYGIQAANAAATGAPAQADGQAPIIPANVPQDTGAMAQRVSQLERMLLTRNAEDEYTTRARVNSDIDAFTSDPANIYVREPGYLDKMAELIRGGQAADLKSAYEAAKWLFPRTRDLEIARATQAQLSGRQQHAAGARQVALSMNGNAPGVIQADPSKMTLRDTLSAAYDGEL